MTLLCREVLSATSLLCDSGGAMRLPQLESELRTRCDITPRDFYRMVNQCPRFLLVRGPGGDADCVVVAKTSLRLCRDYSRGQCAATDCEDLHLCRFFLYGSCRFGKGRKPCRFSHDIRSDHNYRQLRESTLHESQENDLFLLLLQNDPTLLPEICGHYNHGDCPFKENCTKVHLCLHYVHGACIFGLKCNRQHEVNEHNRRMLAERGLSGDIINKLPVIYRNLHYLNAVAHSPVNVSRPTCYTPSDTGEAICLHFLWNHCKFKNKCKFVHFHLPYKWEVFNGNNWEELQNMVDVEREFSDPNKDQRYTGVIDGFAYIGPAAFAGRIADSGVPTVDFRHMTLDSQPVRRLSTISSVLKPQHEQTTDWRWYLRVRNENWWEYGEPFKQGDGKGAFVSSKYLEKQYQKDKSAVVKVVKGQREYVISFNDMYQRNYKYNTRRRIRRRPCFVSVEEALDRVGSC
ncbi:protein mono-ADP-ribosyltransferase PARP12b [Neosynchiropus ocellatus]